MMEYYHVDVFARSCMQGNGLVVIFVDTKVTSQKLLSITREFKQFESIFIYPPVDAAYPVRIFTMDEELEFAGHPILGAAAVIASRAKIEGESSLTFALGKRSITAEVCSCGSFYSVKMNQGKGQKVCRVEKSRLPRVLGSLGLTQDDIHTDYPVEVVSTGLSYLLLPVKNLHSLAKAKISGKDFEAQLAHFKAKFVYLFDPDTLECRTWDNFGIVEDVATGSAAGPLAIYLVKNGYKDQGEKICIKQGGFVARPSLITAWVEATSDVYVQGDVSFFCKGKITL